MHTTLDLSVVLGATLANLDQLAALEDLDPQDLAKGLVLAATAFANCATALARWGDQEGADLFRAHGALLHQRARTGGTMDDLTQSATVARGFARERAPSLFMKVH
jgi:hypothetical protein